MGLHFTAVCISLKENNLKESVVLERLGFKEIKRLEGNLKFEDITLNDDYIYVQKFGDRVLIVGDSLYKIYNKISPSSIRNNSLTIDLYHQSDFDNTYIYLRFANGVKIFEKRYSFGAKLNELIMYTKNDETARSNLSFINSALKVVSEYYGASFEEVEGAYLGQFGSGAVGIGYNDKLGWICSRRLSKKKDPDSLFLQRLRLDHSVKYSWTILSRAKTTGKPILKSINSKFGEDFIRQDTINYEVLHTMIASQVGFRFDTCEDVTSFQKLLVNYID